MATFADALVRELLDARHIASLATENPDGSIHMVAVWFRFDGKHVFVDTSSRSRKARNLRANSKVSLMVEAVEFDDEATQKRNFCGPIPVVNGIGGLSSPAGSPCRSCS